MAKLVREFHPHNIVVTLQHAKDLNIADVNTSDPYVIVSAHRLQSAARGGPKSTNASGELFSYAKSKVIANTLNPTWNEDAYITSAAWNSQVALTVMDSDMVGAHDFLGQVCLFYLFIYLFVIQIINHLNYLFIYRQHFYFQ